MPVVHKHLYLSDLEEAYEIFRAEVAAVVAPDAAERGSFSLVLDDRILDEKEALRASNGRYWFRRPEYRNAYYPFADDPGVYFFFDQKDRAVYVGKSEATLGSRIWSHIGTAGPDGAFPHLEFPDAEYVVVIPFEGARYLAPALESFFLSRFEFQHNTMLAG